MARAKTTTPRRRRQQTEQVSLQAQLDAAMNLASETTAAQLEPVIATLRQQVETCRATFFRLAQCRAADMVVHQSKSWDDAGAYINAEMQGLDQAIAAVVPQEPTT